jgi:hypothetical protein
MARSRSTMSASVGVCTRPSDHTPRLPARCATSVCARVAFRPTSQSASERERAASRSPA